jgi:hypothetical protein
VYYLDPDEIYPKTKEKTGYWLGPAPAVGDFLTYYIYTDDMEQIIARSVVRPFRKGPFQGENIRLGFDPDLDPEPDGHDNLPDLGEIKQEDDSESAQHEIKVDSLLYFLDKKLPARFDLVHDCRARQKHKAKDRRLKKKQLRQAMRHPQSLKHSAARETKTLPERGEDVGPTDLGKSETDDDAKEAELPARKGDESDGTRKTRSGRTTKPAPRLTLKAETTV